MDPLQGDYPRPLSEITVRALALYRDLQAELEPGQVGRGLAIHPDSGDYLVADTPTHAGHAMRVRHPEGGTVTLRIGLLPDYALVSEATLAELSDRGQAIYEADLRQKLEAGASTGFVAIHIDAKEYAVARTSAAAMREMRRRFPADGRLFVRRIGSEPQYGLASRVIQSDMIEGKL